MAFTGGKVLNHGHFVGKDRELLINDDEQLSREALLMEKKKLEAIIACIGDGLSIQDRDYRVIFQNQSSQRLFGDTVGRYCYQVYDGRDSVCEGCPVTLCFQDGGVHTAERKIVSSDGDRFYEITASPLMDAGGMIIGAVELVREVTERRRWQDEILRFNAKLEEQVIQRTRQLSESNQSLQAEIRKRIAAQDEVTWLNEDLHRRTQLMEATNRELEAFSYSVSHDLRAPLRHIEGFSRLLMEECSEALDSQGMDYLTRVCRSSQRMALLIDDLLNLSKVTRSEMRFQPVDLSRMAADVVSELRESSPERKVEIRIQKAMTAWGDQRLLRVVLVNLIGNSWKYTSKKDHATIEFGCRDDNERKVWFVRDDGVGFDMNYADRLFGTFQRLHHAGDFEGTGIGLATVQRIIMRHDGAIWGEGAVGSGATFYFTLPDRHEMEQHPSPESTA